MEAVASVVEVLASDAVVVSASVVEAVEAVAAALVLAVSALASVLAVSVSFNSFGRLSCLEPDKFLKEKLICKSKVPLRYLSQGHFFIVYHIGQKIVHKLIMHIYMIMNKEGLYDKTRLVLTSEGQKGYFFSSRSTWRCVF
nr:hypothetical protein [Bacillus sp. FJAT-27251]